MLLVGPLPSVNVYPPPFFLKKNVLSPVNGFLSVPAHDFFGLFNLLTAETILIFLLIKMFQAVYRLFPPEEVNGRYRRTQK